MPADLTESFTRGVNVIVNHSVLTEGQDVSGTIKDIDNSDPGAPYIVTFQLHGAKTEFGFGLNSLRLEPK